MTPATLTGLEGKYLRRPADNWHEDENLRGQMGSKKLRS